MKHNEIVLSWKRCGLVLARNKEGDGAQVIGDPCIVWDEDIQGWRMILFYDRPGHGHAVCLSRENVEGQQWKIVGPLSFTNLEALSGGWTHKPFVVMEADKPNRAAKIDGRYCLVTISRMDDHKVVQQAWSESLAGPWTVELEPLIRNGSGSDFDAKHVDAVSGFYFPERREILYYYMGYPLEPQARKISPYGSGQGLAVQRVGEKQARKLGEFLPPAQEKGHWASGYVGGFQILPAKRHRWIAIVNASPTAPDPNNKEIFHEEPPPSLAGFAYCDEEWPVRGWQWCPQPIEWIEDIPAPALAAGEGTNLWRQHILVLHDGRAALFYNSGYYGKEQLYMKIAENFGAL